MKKIFIAYADENMAYSLKRIGKQALSLNLFDEVLLWTPELLPEYIRQSPLMKYSRGGGYWAWKPIIIHETLQRYEEGTIVVYIDAGCTLKKGAVWYMLFELMKKHETICFQYPPIVEAWRSWGNASTEIQYWTKKSCIDFLDNKFNDNSYHTYSKILGGCLFLRGKNNRFLQDWIEIYKEHPEIVIDPSEEELKSQIAGYVTHRHDQSLTTVLAYYTKGVLVLPEFMENYGENTIIYTSRIRARNFKDYAFIQTKYYLRKFLGNNLFEKIKTLGRF